MRKSATCRMASGSIRIEPSTPCSASMLYGSCRSIIFLHDLKCAGRAGHLGIYKVLMIVGIASLGQLEQHVVFVASHRALSPDCPDRAFCRGGPALPLNIGQDL